jgi:hypothetical protein
MSLRSSVRPEPSTPSPKKQLQGISRVDAIIESLNSGYNLGIEICDKTLTPSHRQERAKIDNQFARFDKISRTLQQLLIKGGEPFVNRALEAFHRESKAACRKWISKPRADWDTLPVSSLPCKAITPGEQNELQEILVDVLEQLRQRLRPDPIRNERTDGFAIPSRPSQSSTSRPKRPSNEGLESSSKRVKEVDELGHVATVIDKVPARKKGGRDEPAPSIFQSNSRSLNRSFYDASASTSKASLVPSIFSNNDFDPLPASQSTVDPTNDEPKKVPQSSIADSFAPSSGDILALDESFSHYAERGGGSPLLAEPPNQVPGNIASSPEHSTEYSDFPGLLDVQMPDTCIFAPLQSHPLEARLTNIWRRLFLLFVVRGHDVDCPQRNLLPGTRRHLLLYSGNSRASAFIVVLTLARSIYNTTLLGATKRRIGASGQVSDGFRPFLPRPSLSRQTTTRGLQPLRGSRPRTWPL